MSNEDISKVKELLKKHGINTTNDEINSSYNLGIEAGLENCIKLKLDFKYKCREEQEGFTDSFNFYYNFANYNLIYTSGIEVIESDDLLNKFKNVKYYGNHSRMLQEIIREHPESTIKYIIFIFKKDIDFINTFSFSGSVYYYNKEANYYIDRGDLVIPGTNIGTCYCSPALYRKFDTVTKEYIENNMASIDDLLRDYKSEDGRQRWDTKIELVTNK